MKRGILTIILGSMLLAVWGAKPTEAEDTLTASQVFTELPISVLDLVDRSRRLDMLDYYAADSIAKVPNAMEGLSYLEQVTPDYLRVSLTPVSTLTIKLLPLKKGGEVVMTAYTIGDADQAYDTDLRFYDTQYRELKQEKFIKLASLSEFFDCRDKQTRALVSRLVPFPTVRYLPDADGLGLTAELTVGQFMSAEDYDSIKPYLRPPLRYRWTGSKFDLEK